MLLMESRQSDQFVNEAARTRLLDKLQEKGLTPLIRSARLNCYELALLGADRAPELERAVAAWMQETQEGGTAYVRGDVFCFEDFVLYLIFGDKEDDAAEMRAGIIYDAKTTEPVKKLDAFCRNVRDAHTSAQQSARAGEGNGKSADEFAEWQAREFGKESWAAYFKTDEDGSASALQEDVTDEQVRAAELLEDAGSRRLLRRVSEAHTDGRVTELLASDENETTSETLINKLVDAKLLRREVLVSCRKVGRSLFRLPSPDALAMITASNAMCSECGVGIADEKVEDLIVPTDMAAMLLEDGSWLANRLRSVLRSLGAPENRVAVEPVSSDGESHIMLAVGGELFLFVLREGDIAAANVRRILDRQIQTDAGHVVVVATGQIQDEARARLREHAQRRARSGSSVEMILSEGVEEAVGELYQAFERVSQKALAGELAALDASLGLSMGYMIAARFRLMQKSGALTDLAESAVGALAGSLREI